jgi:phosphorylase kinase alpha/beta subunit
LGRVPEGFFQKVWNVLKKTPGGLVVHGHVLAQQPTLTNMTMSDLNFALLVEEMLFKIPRTEYRQIVVDVIVSFLICTS